VVVLYEQRALIHGQFGCRGEERQTPPGWGGV